MKWAYRPTSQLAHSPAAQGERFATAAQLPHGTGANKAQRAALARKDLRRHPSYNKRYTNFSRFCGLKPLFCITTV